MKMLRVLALPLVFAVVSSPAVAHAQATGKQPPPPPMPKPGPEHALFKMDVGTWDAVVEASMAPGQPPAKSKGVEVNTLGCNGLCLISDFKGEMMPGTTFHGHGVATWDASKKRYSGSWTDSMSQGLLIGDSTYDATAKKLTGTMEGPDMTGQVMKMRSVVEYPSATSRVMTAWAAGPDGKEMQVLKITYTKRK
jgi:Protein of unknown function (DUF1579)